MAHTFPRRHLLTAAMAATGGAVLPATLSGPAQAQARKILVIASNQDIPSFDPHVASGYSSAALLRNVYDSLVRVEGNPVRVLPHLASSWTVSPDGME